MPITQALKLLAVNLERGYILFGGEVYRNGGKEPLVDVDIPPYSNAEDSLRRIFAQLPSYTFAVLSKHLVSFYPKSAIDDRTDPLNLKVGSFDVRGERAGVILTWPERFIPELRNRTSSFAPESENAHHIDVYVGSVAGGPLVALRLRDVTVRQILNTVSEATERSVPREEPMGWVYSPAAKSPSGKGEVEYWRLFNDVAPQLVGAGARPRTESALTVFAAGTVPDSWAVRFPGETALAVPKLSRRSGLGNIRIVVWVRENN